MASTIFVLTTLLPLLIFAWVLHSLDAMRDTRAQIGLGLSLLVSLIGFVVLKTTMRRTAETLRLLVRAEGRPHDAPESVVSPAPRTTRAPRRIPLPTFGAPGIGDIQELRDAADAVALRWRATAERLSGRLVLVSVANFDEPESGIIARINETGLVLDQGGEELGVMWRLVRGIALDPRVAETKVP